MKASELLLQSAEPFDKACMMVRESEVLPIGLCADDDHEWEYHEDTFGDHEVINGTGIERWMQCSICGKTKPASYEDMPDYDDSIDAHN